MCAEPSLKNVNNPKGRREYSIGWLIAYIMYFRIPACYPTWTIQSVFNLLGLVLNGMPYDEYVAGLLRSDWWYSTIWNL